MDSLNVQGDSALQLWEVDKHNKPKGPKDEAKLFETINFLNDHPQWVNEHRDEARKYCKLLGNTDITKTKLSKKASAIQSTLIEKYPDLFNLILFEIGKVKKKILKSRLVKRSVKFRAMLKQNMREKNKKKITLEAEGIDREVLKNFVDYLDTGEIKLDGKNVMSMLRLAQEHLIPYLACACLKFIGENLDNDTFIDLLKFAFKNNNYDLKWQCLIYAYKNGKEKDFLALLDSNEISEEGKCFLRLGIQCIETGIIPSLSDNGQRMVKLENKKSIEKTPFDVLKQMNKKLMISGLDIDEGTSSTMLREAQKLVPHLNLSFFKFMGKNFEIDTSKNLLQCVFNSKNDDLNWRCFIFACLNESEEDFQALRHSNKISKEGKRFLRWGSKHWLALSR